MKEVFRPEPLTKGEVNPYPGVRGNIFMAENQGEVQKVPPKSPSQPSPGEIASPEQRWFKEHGISTVGVEAAQEALSRIIPQGIMEEAEARVTAKRREYQEKPGGPRARGQLGGGETAVASEFAQKLRGALGEEIETSTFKAFLERAEVIPTKELYEDFLKTYRETSNRLEEELTRLLPERPENALQVAAHRGAIKRLHSEAEKITKLFVETEATREEGTTDQIREIIKEIESEIGGLEGEELKAKIKELRPKTKALMDRFSPHDSPIPDEVLRLIISDEVLAEKFISELIVLPIEDEPHQIRSWYGVTNEEKFRRLAPSLMKAERWDYIKDLIQANTAFHNMNYIIKRGFDQFGPQSEALLPKYFKVLSQIPGVDTILRLYEDFHQEALGVETEITEEHFEQIDKKVREELERIGQEKNEKGELILQGIAGQELENWERFRALILGRNFFRILVRAAEHITLSELPEWGDPKLWTSLPQRQLTQILNVLKFTGIRFRPGEALGGDIFLKEALKINESEKKARLKTLQGTDVDMRESAWIIGSRGVLATWRNAEIVLEQIKFYEGEKLTNIVQFFRDHKTEIEGIKYLSEKSWKEWKRINSPEQLRRANEEYQKKMEGLSEEDRWQWKQTPEGQKLTNQAKLFQALQTYQKISQNEKEREEWRETASREEIDLVESFEDLKKWKKTQVRFFFTPLLDNNSIALGILVSPSGLDSIAQVPVELKEILWEKIAKLNPLVMASMLRRLEVTSGRVAKSLEEILAEKWGTPDQKSAVSAIKTTKRLLGEKQKELDKLTAKKADTSSLRAEIDSLRRGYSSQDAALKSLFGDERWKSLARKLRLTNELRVKDGAERLENKDGALKRDPKELNEFLSGELAFTPEEKKIIDEIIVNGEEIAKDLARVRQSYSWFLNDTPFKILDWMAVGAFYDRQTGDLAAFNKGAEEILAIMSSPFGQKPEEILKHFSRAIGADPEFPGGAGRVIGVAEAQDRQKPLFKAWLRLIYEKPLLRPKIVSGLLHAFRRPTSRAQEIAGPNAPAVNEDGMFDILDKALPMGILRQEVRDKETGKVKWKGTFNEFVKDFDVGVFKRLVWAKLRDYTPIVLMFLLFAFFNKVAKEKM